MTVISQEEFARPQGVPLSLDLFHPGTANAPVIVYIHGGGWISGDRTTYADEAEWATQQGFAAVVFDYRLAPLYPFPAAVLDARSAIGFLRENAARFDIDPRRIACFGNSAGGHLATMCGVCTTGLDGSEPFAPVQAVVDVCGISDIRNPDVTQFPISMSFVEQFMGGAYAGREEAYALASPIAHINGACCPFLILHGTEDDVVPTEQSRSLAARLIEVGGRADLVELEGEGHSFSFYAWDEIRQKSLDFLREAL